MSTFTRKEIAEMYGVSIRTIRRWLKSIGFEASHKLITPKELEIIFTEIGEP